MITRRAFLAGAGVAAAGSLIGWRVAQRSGDLTLDNGLVQGRWSIADGVLRAVSVSDRSSGRSLPLSADVCALVFRDGTTLGTTALRVTGEPRVSLLAGDPGAARLAARLPGRALTVELADPDGRFHVTWRAELRDGSRYVRQEVTLRGDGPDGGGEVPIREVRLVDLDLAGQGAEVRGAVRGSPIVAGSWFLAFEHPLADVAVANGRAQASLARELPLRPRAPVTYSAVVGVVSPGQVRRDFLTYLERERAHPYRPFLHYNSWYDIGYFSKFDEAAALDAIAAVGRELHERRGVHLDSFLFDDGWDDPHTLWRFHAGFPRGFTPLRAAAARYGAAPGVWLSPWGGYGKPKEDRLSFGRAQGFETNEGGFALSGPKYYARFRETCLDMIRRYGVNQFKFDGTENVAHAIPGGAFDSDFSAMLALIADLRAEKPDLYVNLTSGTYPSPFFLRHADSIWRGGEDHDFTGVGSDRQRWITYRDADTYAGIVRKGPLFPLNALMLHGVIYARHANHLDSDPGGDFTSECRAYFGTGTQLQELYITPALLSPANWDALAEAARWSRDRAAILVDTHWVGGDPGALEVYGHAAWLPGKGTLVLRNPKDVPQGIELDIGAALEVPADAPRRFSARSPWAADRAKAPVVLEAAMPHRFDLAPFEVLTLDVDAVA
ncbi:MAG: enterotoxin [Gemmatimonadetes bacterium 13_1_20CM_4_66_11]|nr:MAG: enterotoxin [Gemmatimonadetes bacterium 13_1_20CM_4_66_11]